MKDTEHRLNRLERALGMGKPGTLIITYDDAAELERKLAELPPDWRDIPRILLPNQAPSVEAWMEECARDKPRLERERAEFLAQTQQWLNTPKE